MSCRSDPVNTLEFLEVLVGSQSKTAGQESRVVIKARNKVGQVSSFRRRVWNILKGGGQLRRMPDEAELFARR